MGQMGQQLRIGVIGAGRVGAVLAVALREAGHEVVAVAGESNASRTRIETMLPGVHVDKPTAVARAADVLLLTVPDDVLDNVVRMLVGAGAIHAGQYVVHTSGRHGLAVLDPAREVGARPVAMHPAMTFTGTDLDLPRLPDCAFGVTAAEAERPMAQALVAALRGRLVWVDESHRTLYHAALAHGANHLVTLVSEAMALLRTAGSDDPAAALRPLLTAALDNTLAYGDAALTGPIVRGDIETVRLHLADLVDKHPEMLASYLAMARATVRHAVADGRLDQLRAGAFEAAFDEAATRTQA
jgi:predicted short-subunit dehydrogenase-like oxidoreductase (DUF2520 family)